MSEKHDVELQATAKSQASVAAGAIRGPASWQFLYTFLGFALTIEAGIVALIKPLEWPWNLVFYIAWGIATVWLFLFNGWFQNKLIGWKKRYENASR